METYLSFMPEDGFSRAALAVVSGGTLYLLGLVVYRLFISPLAKFPGPKLAAISGWYESYYDLVHKGKYLFEIEKMHDTYGPIVRINPFELSIRDSEYYDTLYVAGSVRPTNRYEGFVDNIVDFKGAHIATIDHHLHRQRRKPLDSYFSRLGISKFEPMLAELTEKLNKRFDDVKGTGKVIRLDHALTSYSGDVIQRLCIDNPPNTLIEDGDFSPWWYNMFHKGIGQLPLFMALPGLISLIRLVPMSFMAKLSPSAHTFNVFKKFCDDQLVTVNEEKAALGSKGDLLQGGRPTIFRHLLNSDLPQSELDHDRLSKEAQVLIGAGTITTAGTMCFISYYIIANPHIKKRLQEELAPIMADYPRRHPTWAKLEQATYFQAVIKEGFRLSYGTMHRRTRVFPQQALQFKDWTIPPGVPVGMSAYFCHRDPEIFPRPEEFLPERWLGDVTPEMRRNFVPFSKGSRRCLGENLAYAEISHVLSALFRPQGPRLELYETGEMDVKMIHDLIVPLPSLESKGFRVTFH